MSMNHEQRLSRFRRVLAHLPPINEAPPSPYAEMPETMRTTGAERDEFYSKWYEKEGLKRYKAMDGGGQVYEMRNPAVDRYEQRDSGKPIKYSPKRLLGNIEDLMPSLEYGYDKAEAGDVWRR